MNEMRENDSEMNHHHLCLTSVVHTCTGWGFCIQDYLHLTRSNALLDANPIQPSPTSHSSQVFLPLPLFLTPLISKLLHTETHSSISFLSSRPNHCSLLHLTTYVIHSMPRRLYRTIITGCTEHLLNQSGKMPVEIDRLIMLVIVGSRMWEHKNFVLREM